MVLRAYFTKPIFILKCAHTAPRARYDEIVGEVGFPSAFGIYAPHGASEGF